MDVLDEILENYYSIEEKTDVQLTGLESFNCMSLYELALAHGNISEDVVRPENED